MESRTSTGCSTCKTRRKKCDETYPRCQRCTKSGTECGGYEYLKPKGGKITRRRIVPGPKSSRLATQADQIVLASRPTGDACIPDTLLSTASDLEPIVLASSSTIGPWIHSGTDRLGALEPQLPGSSRSSRLPGQESDVIPTPGCGGYTCWQTALVSHQDPNDIQPPIRSHMSTPQGITPTQPQQDLSSSLFSTSKASPEERQPTSQQAGLYWEFSSFDRLQPLPPESLHVFESSASTGGSYWPLSETEVGEDETHDPEGIRELWISTPAIDSTVPSNLLAFVLQSYGNWMALTAFDPTRMVLRVKEALVQQIESSDTARTRVWLISTAMGTLNNVSLLDPKAGELISMLAGSIHQAASSYKSSPPTHAPGVDRRKASSALDNILEIMALQAYAKPFSTILSLLASAAPAFRRACPGPLDTLVNLANILLEPKFNLRHFAFFDVVLGVVTGRPMHFRYDVEFSIELCNQINSVDKEFGLEWMHGTPNQFILLFAWMNGLREDCCAGAGPVSSEAIVRIEQYLRDLTFTLGLSETPDPVLRIGRLVVQECWRQAAYVYLYMGLCGANNQDSRVTKAFLGFMRLINGVKPGRFPDAYLIIPWIILGMASTQTQCRETIRRRLSSRPECWNPAASGCDILRMLDNVWARSEAEGRPIVWEDLRIACFRVTGM